MSDFSQLYLSYRRQVCNTILITITILHAFTIYDKNLDHKELDMLTLS